MRCCNAGTAKRIYSSRRIRKFASGWKMTKSSKFDDPAMRAYMLQKSGLNEGDVPSAAKAAFHVNEVDNVFVATADDEESDPPAHAVQDKPVSLTIIEAQDAIGTIW